MIINLQLRRDTAANWAAANPTLLVGEMGLETDSRQVKIGDGEAPWNTLIYGGIQAPTSQIEALIDAEAEASRAAEAANALAITTVAADLAAEAVARQDADGAIESTANALANDLSAEVARAATAEQANATALAAVAADLATADSTAANNLSAEVTRATTVEGLLTDAITAEAAAARAAEGVNAADISAEVARAVAAESALQGSISAQAATLTATDAALTSAIATESARASTAESALRADAESLAVDMLAADASLNTRIDNVLTNIDETALNSLTEIVSAFQAADATINGAITSLADSATTNLAAEVARAVAAEAAAINAAAADATSKVNAINTSIRASVVTGFNGRLGEVAPATGDYGSDQITIPQSMSALGTTVSEALLHISETPGTPGPMGSLLGVITVTGTTRTLTAADNGYLIYCTAATAITVTTATGLGAAFSCMVVQAGAGQITVAQGAGTTLQAYSGLKKSAGQYAALTLFTPIADTFILAGATA